METTSYITGKPVRTHAHTVVIIDKIHYLYTGDNDRWCPGCRERPIRVIVHENEGVQLMSLLTSPRSNGSPTSTHAATTKAF
jgi:hypothetical protein